MIFCAALFSFANFANADFFPENWGIQRENFKISALKSAPHEALILPIQKENGDFWTAEEITEIKKNGKKVLAAFPIGEISFGKFGFEEARGNECKGEKTGFSRVWNTRTREFDYEKNCRENSILGPEFEDRGGTFLTQFWTEEWKKIVIYPIFQKVYLANFDGVFLEKINDFEAWTGSVSEKKTYFANEMAKLVIEMASQARSKKGSNFLVVVSETSRLFENLDTKKRSDFLSSIDAVGEISLFFDTEKKNRATRFVQLRKYVVPARKPILLLEFSSEKNAKKLQKWQIAFERVGLPTVIFRAENDENLNELPLPFVAKEEE